MSRGAEYGARNGPCTPLCRGSCPSVSITDAGEAESCKRSGTSRHSGWEPGGPATDRDRVLSIMVAHPRTQGALDSLDDFRAQPSRGPDLDAAVLRYDGCGALVSLKAGTLAFRLTVVTAVSAASVPSLPPPFRESVVAGAERPAQPYLGPVFRLYFDCQPSRAARAIGHRAPPNGTTDYREPDRGHAPQVLAVWAGRYRDSITAARPESVTRSPREPSSTQRWNDLCRHDSVLTGAERPCTAVPRSELPPQY
jgi:hypothetical protein